MTENKLFKLSQYCRYAKLKDINMIYIIKQSFSFWWKSRRDIFKETWRTPDNFIMQD